MATANSSEYLEIDNVPLSTPAWDTEDLASVLQGPGVRGSDLLVPIRAGELARRRILTSRVILVPIVVNGYYDSDGVAHADPRAGLIENLNELKLVLAPNYRTTAGTRTLEWVNTTTAITKTAAVHVSPAIGVTAIGPHAARVVIEFTLPGGVWRASSNTTHTINIASGITQVTSTITNPGTGQVEDATITVTGASGGSTAASFKIFNESYGAAASDVYLEYPATVNNTLTIYTETFTATLGATQVGGAIVNAGTPLWLPILPGANNLKLQAPSNVANLVVTVAYKAVYL